MAQAMDQQGAGMSGTPLITLKNVSRHFKGSGVPVMALQDVSLTVNTGEFVAILGKSGSGKSTLLNMITGIDHPSDGVVTINATDIHTLDESSLARWRGQNIGIVFQFFQLIPTLTVLENLLLAMELVNTVPAKERINRACSLLEQVGIAGHADKLPSALSGGEQQRAAIARALANNPPLLIADEPTGNLDSKTAQEIKDIFAKLIKNGTTVVVVTHEEISGTPYDRVFSLSDGRIVGDNREQQLPV